MQQRLSLILPKLESKLIQNPAILLLLALFNCAVTMNFFLLTPGHIGLTTLVFSMLILTAIHPKLWWTSLVNIAVCFNYFVYKFPRLPNHCNLEMFVSFLIFMFLFYKITKPKFTISPQLLSWIFRITLVSIYFYTGFHKLNTAFFNPCVSCVVAMNETIVKNFTGLSLQIPYAVSVGFQYATLFLELFLPFGLLWHRTRKPTAMVLLCFHCYLAFTFLTAFSAFVAFLILGCLLDFESKTLHAQLVKGVRIYIAFIVLAFLVKKSLISFGFDYQLASFFMGCVYNIGYILFFYHYFKTHETKKIILEKSGVLVLATCVLAISFWTLKSYIGLGNAANLTMYSNLSTEASQSNHLLINTKKTKLFHFEEDHVLVLKLADTLKSQQLEGYKVPLVEFQFLASQWSEHYKTKLNATLLYKKDTIKIDDLKHSKFAQSKWWYKYLYFRKIQAEGPTQCQW